MTISKYTLLVLHDSGTIRISTVASSAGAAVDIVCKAEGCPRNAVKIINIDTV